MAGKRLHLPLWVTNVLVFACLAGAVFAYFLWENRQVRHEYLMHARDNARLVAEVVRISAQAVTLSRHLAEGILIIFMENSARFVDYLDGVEPFAETELEAFALEAGLAGISINRPGGDSAAGPRSQVPVDAFPCRSHPGLKHVPQKGLYVFSLFGQTTGACIQVGVSDRDIGAIQEELGLEAAAARLSALPGLRYISLKETDIQAPASSFPVRFLETDEGPVADVVVMLDGQTVAVGLDATELSYSLHRLRRDFVLFTAALVLLGFALSMVLYRQQKSYLAKVRAYEERIAAEREAAALGRTAAAIAHEIRNPLNAIGMGLQRLPLEAKDLSPQNHRMVNLMQDAVRRANATVTGLLKYAKPQQPRLEWVRLDKVLKGVLDLHQARCESLHIEVAIRISHQGTIPGDPDLLAEVIENLVRNAVQAQSGGGFLDLTLEQDGESILLCCRNGGFSLPAGQAERILEPYFTTRATGTGLGLPIAQRIVEAHKGHLKVFVPVDGVVEIQIRLPSHFSEMPPAHSVMVFSM